MSAPEGIPLWDSVTHPLANALELAFGCHHSKLSRVFTIEGHTYKVCCDCGQRFEYSLRTMSNHAPAATAIGVNTCPGSTEAKALPETANHLCVTAIL